MVSVASPNVYILCVFFYFMGYFVMFMCTLSVEFPLDSSATSSVLLLSFMGYLLFPMVP